MSNPAQLRYLADSVSTSSPMQLLVMLYDRLVLDIHRAADAQESGEPLSATDPIRHAQQIIAELRSNLRLDVWEGAENLASLYTFITGELIAVNGTPDASRLRIVEGIVSGLRDSWRGAALALLEQSKPVVGSADGPATGVHGTIAAPAAARPIAWVG
jgi:flagellar protein FliS